MNDNRFALIVGAGKGLSASLARKARAEGMTPLLAARDTAKLEGLVGEVSGHAHACDGSDPASVAALFDWVAADFGVPELVIYNPSARARGPIAELDPEAVRNVLMVTAFGGFLVGQAAARAMLPRGSGSILFTGASASVKGYANSSSFAMGKFGLRGLAQSMARELAPKGIHVGHFVIDGGIGESDDAATPNKLHPDHIADNYFHLHKQPRSAWTWEMELRPFVENF
ncbi:SDR family NAD(P)-dependent oxidoreductase [Thalassospiraceae bacterium LMO-JJ14]|nr:SDR family NAD(P)-dependent oxidoreductase [Thalassospiraceae bacterium LMO-JJ14]